MATELLWYVRHAQVHVAKLQEIGTVPPMQPVFPGAARGTLENTRHCRLLIKLSALKPGASPHGVQGYWRESREAIKAHVGGVECEAGP